MIFGIKRLAEESDGLQPPGPASRWQGKAGKPEPAPAGKDGGDRATVTIVCWQPA